MSHSWALIVPGNSAPLLARLRPFSSLANLEAADEIWLRGSELDDALDRQLRLVPGARRPRVLEDGQTVPEGKRVPLGYLPKGTWVPFEQWLVIVLPTIRLARSVAMPVRLSLVPSGQEREPSILETSMEVWHGFVAAAPQWRIDRWTFMADCKGRVLVRGIPLAPIPGTRCVVEDDVAVPAGLTWSPPLDVRTLRQALGLVNGQVALLNPDGSWDRIEADDWVRASRSAARATIEVLQHVSR